MVRSKGITISVKIPIHLEEMTENDQQRLRQTVGRDTRVIRSYLGIIERYENTLLSGKHKVRIDSGRLQELSLTALKVKAGKQQRTTVPHDMKQRFPRISQNESVECLQTAVSMYESYLRLRKKKGRKTSRPTHTNSTRRIPRWVFSQRFKLIQRESKVRWWVSLRDSFDSEQESWKTHDRLLIPLKTSPFHLNQIQRGEVKALQIFTDRNRKWWITFAVRMPEQPETKKTFLPVAVLGIDLGIEKAACTSLVTPEKVRETRFFVQKDKVVNLKKYDQLVSELQYELSTKKNSGVPYDGIAQKLRTLKGRRENIAREYDRVLVRQLLDYISDLSEKYTLYVALGRIKNIRVRAQKNNRAGRTFRGMLHSWAFARITISLSHGLAQLGWSVNGKDAHFQSVPEAWTSIMCWKCNHKGARPRQNLFICPTCGNKCNADMNGAINIAGRLIMLTSSLHGVGGQGKWASAIARSKRPKARRTKSDGKSLLSKGDASSDPGESAAVHHAQSSLSDFGDKIEMGDNDPAVENTVENLSVADGDASAVVQEKDAGSAGGIVSL